MIRAAVVFAAIVAAQTPQSRPAPRDPVPLMVLASAAVRAPAGFRLPAKGPLRVTVEWESNVPEPLRRVSVAGASDDPKNGTSSFVYSGPPAGNDPAEKVHLAASFVVDFDTGKDFPRVRADIERRFGKTPSLADLLVMTDQLIPKKDMQRGLDAASVVLKRGQGDCTEHAVLLAALARMFKIPARVVTGVVVAEAGGKLISAGHAWVEYRSGDRWRHADPSLASPAIYIPLAIAYEGASGAAMLGKETSIVHVKSIALEEVDGR